ncbi:efflux RND transporter permease subunit, partial [Rosenbergiella collisarenosi]
ANQDPRLSMVRHNGMDDEAQYQLSIDEEKAKADGLSESDINSTLSAAWGGSYVNQFLYNGRVKNVYLQGRAAARITPEDLNKW